MRWYELVALTTIGALYGGAFFVIGVRVDVDIAYQDTIFNLSGMFSLLLIVGLGAAITLYVIWIRSSDRPWIILAAFTSCAVYALGLAYAGSATATAFVAAPISDRALLEAYNLSSKIEGTGITISRFAALVFIFSPFLREFYLAHPKTAESMTIQTAFPANSPHGVPFSLVQSEPDLCAD